MWKNASKKTDFKQNVNFQKTNQSLFYENLHFLATKKNIDYQNSVIQRLKCSYNFRP